MKRKISSIEIVLLSIIIIYCIVVAIVNPAFLSIANLFDMLRSASVSIILAMGVLVVLLSGGIDVSFTAITIFGGYASILFMLATGWDNLLIAILVSCTVGVILGLVNALIVHYFKLTVFIATLGTSFIFQGIMSVVLGTKNIGPSDMPRSLTKFGLAKIVRLTDSTGSLTGLTVFIIPTVIVVVSTWFLLYKTMIGRKIFAMGSSQESAVRIGLRLLPIQLFIFGFVGILAGIAGVINVAQSNYCNPISFVGTELSIIASVVIGGAKPSGGHGTVFGTLLGVMILYLFNSTLVFLGLSSSWNNLFIGVILTASIAVTSYQEKVKNREKLLFTE